MNNKIRILSVLFLLTFSGCGSFLKTNLDQKSTTITTQYVLDHYGYPAKVQKYLNFEVWTYLEESTDGTRKCLYYFNKNQESGPGKCSISTRREPSNMKSSGSRKVVFNY